MGKLPAVSARELEGSGSSITPWSGEGLGEILPE